MSTRDSQRLARPRALAALSKPAKLGGGSWDFDKPWLSRPDVVSETPKIKRGQHTPSSASRLRDKLNNRLVVAGESGYVPVLGAKGA